MEKNLHRYFMKFFDVIMFSNKWKVNEFSLFFWDNYNKTILTNNLRLKKIENTLLKNVKTPFKALKVKLKLDKEKFFKPKSSEKILKEAFSCYGSGSRQKIYIRKKVFKNSEIFSKRSHCILGKMYCKCHIESP